MVSDDGYLSNAVFFVLSLIPALFGLPALLAASLLGQNVRRNLPLVSACFAFILAGLSRGLALFGSGFRIHNMLVSYKFYTVQACLVIGVDLMLTCVLFGIVHFLVRMLKDARKSNQEQELDTSQQLPHLTTMQTTLSVILPYTSWTVVVALCGRLSAKYPHNRSYPMVPRAANPIRSSGLPYCNDLFVLACGPNGHFGIPRCQDDAIVFGVVIGLAEFFLSAILFVYGTYGFYLWIRVMRDPSSSTRLNKDSFYRQVATATVLWSVLLFRVILGTTLDFSFSYIGDWILTGAGATILFIYGTQPDVVRIWIRWMFSIREYAQTWIAGHAGGIHLSDGPESD